MDFKAYTSLTDLGYQPSSIYFVPAHDDVLSGPIYLVTQMMTSHLGIALHSLECCPGVMFDLHGNSEALLGKSQSLYFETRKWRQGACNTIG